MFGVVTLIYFGITTAQQDHFILALTEYFTCEAVGKGPCDANYEEYIYPALASITFLLMGFIPLINLTFVVNWRWLREVMVSWCRCRDKDAANVQSVHSTFSPQPSLMDDPSVDKSNN